MAYQNNNYNGGYNRNNSNSRPQPAISNFNLSDKEKLDKKTYVSEAEKIIKLLVDNGGGKINLKTNQIRNILSLINELYDMVRTNTDSIISDDVQSHVQYVKMKIIYMAGREPVVKDFVLKSKIVNYLNGIDDSRENLILVCRYMESLVAYHKFNTDEK